MSANELPPKPIRKSKTGCILGCVFLPVVIVVISLIAAAVLWFVESHQTGKELAAEIQKVRAKGEPLTTVELDEFYTAAPGRPDMTAELLAALAICESPHLKAEAKGMPIVGTGTKPPLPPEVWHQQEAAEAFLAQHQPAFEILHEVAQRDGTARYPIDLSPGVFSNLEHVQAMRNMARVLSLKTAVDLHRGETHHAVENIAAMMALANTLDRMPLMVPHLVRVAIYGVATKDLNLVIRCTHPSDGDLRRIQQALRKIRLESSVKDAFLGERAHGYTTCLDPLLMASPHSNPTPEQVRQIVSRSPQRLYDAELILRLNTRTIEAFDNGLVAAMNVAKQVDVELDGLSKNKANRFFYILPYVVMPASHAATRAFARGVAERDSADAAIAAELYRRQQGRWPETLEQLVPEFLPAVPLDPFSSQPLRMVTTDTEFKVYSVGKDGKDDGGVFSDRQEPDVGFVILRSQ